MEDQGDPGRRNTWPARIALALERLAAADPRLTASPDAAPTRSTGTTDWLAAPAYVWTGKIARPVAAIDAPAPPLLRGIDRQKLAALANVARLARGEAAHDMLLWGARGMGKSALVRASVKAAQDAGGTIALVQVTADALPTLGALFTELADVSRDDSTRPGRNFLVYLDDLGFAPGDGAGPRLLRSWLDGGVEARPGNTRLAVTANRRAIVPREMAEQGDPLNPRDAVDDQLALADRFGLSLGFHACSQEDYLAILRGYAAMYALDLDEPEALEWAKRRGQRSGRTAWHFITELAGRAGRTLG